MTPGRKEQWPPARRRSGGEDGAVMVEFALVLPLLLLMLLGILDFGRAVNYRIDETHLANVAARWAAVDRNPGPEGSLQESVLAEADSAELREGGTSSVEQPARVCIEFPNGEPAKVGDPVKATVSVEYDWLSFVSHTLGIGRTTLSGSATMRLEALPSAYEAGCS